MENSLKELDEYLEKIGRSEFVTEEQNYSLDLEKVNESNGHCEVREKSNTIHVMNVKSNTVDNSDKSLSQSKTNEKSIKFTRDFTPNQHNTNDSFTQSLDENTNNDHGLEADATIEVCELSGPDFIDNVKTESLQFEESDEAINELAEIGLNKQSLQNFATSNIVPTVSSENVGRNNDGLVHPVALKKSANFFKAPETKVKPQAKGQVTTLLDISSITELKRLWVRKDNADKRVSIAANKRNNKKYNLTEPKKASKTMQIQRLFENSGFKKKVNIERNTKVFKKTGSAETDRNKSVHKDLVDCQIKQCSVKLVRVEDLPNLENLKIVLSSPKEYTPIKLESSISSKREGNNSIKNTERKKQILLKIKAISNRKNQNLKSKTKTLEATPKLTLETASNKPKVKTSLLETTVKKVCDKIGMVRKKNGKVYENFEEVQSVPDRIEMPEDLENEAFLIIKNENDENFDDGYGDDDDDYVPSDDDKDDDYHPKKKLKKSKSKKKPTCQVNNHFVEVKNENDPLPADDENHTKSKRVKGTRIGRPPVFGHFECKNCDFTANEKNLVDKHHAKTHRKQIYECEHCDKIFKSITVFLEHNAYNHDGGKPFKCEHEGCPYASKNHTDLSRHQAKHETELRHVCTLCGWRTKWRRNMRHHHIMKHSVERNYQCTICDFAAKRKQDLKQHLFRHTDTKPIECFTCGFRVKTNFELRSHMLVHTNEKPFKCTFPGCASSTKTKSDLTKHMRIHKTERPFKCDICSKTYKDLAALNKHHRGIHVEGRKFNCDICGKMFKNKYALKKHVLLHSGFKPYDCSVCGWKFRNRNNLEKHMVTHDTTKRPYLCPICPYAAKETDHLLAHIGSFHGDKYAYFCELCRKPFKRYMQLNVHYERMHTKEEVEKLKMQGNTDLALLKMEMKLEVEEKEAGNSRKRKNSNKGKAVNEIDVKKEPIDEEYADAASNVNDDLDEVRLNENTGLMENVKKRRLNSRSPEERERSPYEEEDVNIEDNPNKESVENTEGMEKTDRAGKDNEIETDDDNCNSQMQEQGDEAGVKDEEKVGENMLIAKDEIRTIASCKNFRLPLATRGFKFNYDKTGKKPANSWFMDTSLMDKETAERHKKYNRRIGLLPPIPRGHPPKGYKRLKNFVDKRKKQLSDKVKKAKCTKDFELVARKNTPRSIRFSNKYTEFETFEDEISVEQDQEQLPNIKAQKNDTIKESPKELQSSYAQQTKTKSSTEKHHTLNETKHVVKGEKVLNGKVKKNFKKLSTKKGLKTSKLLLSTEKRKGRKVLNLNIRKPVFLDRLDCNKPVREVNQKDSDVTGETTLPESGVQNGYSVTESNNEAKDENEIENERMRENEIDTNSMYETETQKRNGQEELNDTYLKKSVQQRLKQRLQCKNGKLKKVPKHDRNQYKNNSKGKRITVGIKEKVDYSTVYPVSSPLHVPLKDSPVVMVYPTKIVQNTGMAIFASVNEGRAFTVTEPTTDLANNSGERVRIKEEVDDDDDALENGSDDVKVGTSDKDIMKHEYLTFIKEEPDLEYSTNVMLE